MIEMAPPMLNRIPLVRRIPIARLIIVAEVAMLAGEHVGRLDPEERRRVLALLRRGRGRPSNLSRRERAELATLVAKAEPKLFARAVARKFSPI
jgi:ABC-type polar amino acid transport system ATPase subunit